VTISVITAVRNNRAHITDALDSILAQSYRWVESIVIDGASTDGTIELIQAYGSRLDVVVSERDEGIYSALNKGIERANGGVIGFLHSDDLYVNNHVLEKVAEVFADPSVDGVYGDLLYVGSEDTDRIVRYWKSGTFSPKKLGRGWMPPHPTLYVRRATYERVGAFNTRYTIAADYDWILRFFGPTGVTCHYIPEPLIKMRVGGVSNRSISLILTKSLEDLHTLRSNGVGGLASLVMKNLRKIPQFFVRPPLTTTPMKRMDTEGNEGTD
jgi:glycosyltransferase involved in cell wall biosynthesis